MTDEDTPTLWNWEVTEFKKKAGCREHIGTRIKEIMDSQSISVKDAAAALHPLMGIVQNTAMAYFYDIRRGKITLTYDREKSLTHKLNWLSILMYSISIDEQDDLVAKTRELYPKFQFPPLPEQQYVLNINTKPAGPYDSLSLKEKLDRLKPDDARRLEITVDSILALYDRKKQASVTV